MSPVASGDLGPVLIAEATRRSEAVWIAAPDSPPRLVWHVWHDGALHVVGGEGEQQLPELGELAVVTVRSRARPTDRVVQWQADVAPVLPGTPEWEAVVPVLAAARLNARQPSELAAQWADGLTRVLRLAPRPDAGSAPRPPAPPSR